MSEKRGRGGDWAINDMHQKLDPKSDGVIPSTDQSSVHRPARGRMLLVIIMLAISGGRRIILVVAFKCE